MKRPSIQGLKASLPGEFNAPIAVKTIQKNSLPYGTDHGHEKSPKPIAFTDQSQASNAACRA